MPCYYQTLNYSAKFSVSEIRHIIYLLSTYVNLGSSWPGSKVNTNHPLLEWQKPANPNAHTPPERRRRTIKFVRNYRKNG